MKIDAAEMAALAEARHGEPQRILGFHAEGGGAVVRVWDPDAQTVELLLPGQTVPMSRLHAAGIFEAPVKATECPAYRVRVTLPDGAQVERDDPYRFPFRISDLDTYLHGEGTHYRCFEKMGAHLLTVDGVPGSSFAVWAPNAVRVSVIGDFNQWDGRRHPMQNRGSSGLWELFLPGVGEGALYKFEILGPQGFLGEKSDPYAFAAEVRPRTASVVCPLHRYEWNDRAWMDRRARTDWHREPVSIYEVHLGS